MWLSVHPEKGRTPRGDVLAGKAPKKKHSPFRCVCSDSVTVLSHDELAEGLRVAREEGRDHLLLEVTPEVRPESSLHQRVDFRFLTKTRPNSKDLYTKLQSL